MTYSDEIKQRARALRSQGVAVRAIAEVVGVSTSAVSAWTRDLAAQTARQLAGGLPQQRAEREELMVRAIELRLQGLSTTQIARELGIRRSSTLSGWLVGTPTPQWTRRPRAKDDLRVRAREMRGQGLSYTEIARELNVSKSSVSLWVRDLPTPERLSRGSAHAQRISQAYWEEENRRRDVDRQQTKLRAALEVGELSRRELLLVGTVLYWAEGGKDKPYARREQLRFINSDVRVTRLYLRWLDLLGVDESRRVYRLSIHDTADLEAAHRFWSEAIDVPVERFRRPSLKRHNPRTKRLNTGADYHGCLAVSVLQSRADYQWMDGMFHAISAGADRLLGEEQVCGGGSGEEAVPRGRLALPPPLARHRALLRIRCNDLAGPKV